MLEFVLLYFLCKKNASLAEQKNVSKSRWVLTTIFYWIVGEIFGLVLFLNIVEVDVEAIQLGKEITKELVFMMCAGLLGGYLAYLFTRKRLEDLPDPNGSID